MLSSNTVRILYVQRTYDFALSTLKFPFLFFIPAAGRRVLCYTYVSFIEKELDEHLKGFLRL